MGDLISREALLEKAIKAYRNDGGKETPVMIIERDEVISAPAIAAAPVQRGKWIWNEHACGFYMNGYVCSLCKKGAFYDTSYCPYCGAKMDGVEK